MLAGSTLALAAGTISGDRALGLTDEFPDPGTVEVDLGGGRAWLRFTIPPGDTASNVEARIGFRDIRDERRDCVDLRRLAQRPGANPFRAAGFTIEVGSGSSGDRAGGGSYRGTCAIAGARRADAEAGPRISGTRRRLRSGP